MNSRTETRWEGRSSSPPLPAGWTPPHGMAGGRASRPDAEALLRAALGGAKARSLIVSFMGDVVSVQPQPVWLGSLIAALAGLGLNERSVRTTCNRLTREGWLRSQRCGRRSYYHFSAFGARQYQRAAARIYAPAKPAWDGFWTIVLAAGLPPPQRERLAEQLGWLGFGRLRGEVLIRAGYGDDHRALLEELGAEAPVFRAQGDALGDSLPRLCRETWAVDELNQAYRSFMERFAPWADAAPTLSPHTAFRLRFCLVHAYRRIVLTDPELPANLLPSGWQGDAARRLAASLYHRWLDASEAWLATVLQPQSGAWPAKAAALGARFRDATWSGRLVALA